VFNEPIKKSIELLDRAGMVTLDRNYRYDHLLAVPHMY
jgi:hypothetical protein